MSFQKKLTSPLSDELSQAELSRSHAKLASRLKSAIKDTGGLSAILSKTEISKAQLTRYLQGSPIPSTRLLSLAKILNVSAGWLLGETSASKNMFFQESAHARDNFEKLLRLLQRYDVERAFLPTEISRVMEIIMISQHHALEHEGAHNPLSDYDLENGLNFLNTIRRNDWLDVYVDGCAYYSEHGSSSLHEYWSSKWSAICQEAFKTHFTREPMITDYFARLNLVVRDQHLKVMQTWIAHVCEIFSAKAKIDILDAGCGNGRHLVYLHQVSDRFNLAGIDASSAAIEQFCKVHERNQKLPPNCTQIGDFMALPYADASFDAYQSIANLMFIPLIPDSLDIGVGLALREARRVLRKGGCMMFLIRSQSPDEFFPVFQCSHAPQALQKLLDKAGFQTAKRIPVTLNELGLPGTRFGRGLKHQELWITHTL